MSFDREGHRMGWISWFLNLLKKTPTYLFMSPTTVLWNQYYSSRAQASFLKVPLVILLSVRFRKYLPDGGKILRNMEVREHRACLENRM